MERLYQEIEEMQQFVVETRALKRRNSIVSFTDLHQPEILETGEMPSQFGNDADYMEHKL